MSQINDLPLHSIQGMPDGQRIAFVQAQWHADIVHQARDAFLAELERQGIPADTIDVFDVPGAFEIPLHAKRLAQSGLMPPSSAARWWWTVAFTATSLWPQRWSMH